MQSTLGLSKSSFISNSNRVRSLCGCGSKAVLADQSMTEDGDEYRFKGSGGCMTIDYDVIYDESPTDYMDNYPCETCIKRTIPPIDCEYDEDENCINCTVGTYPPNGAGGWDGEVSEAPHGEVLEYEHVLCSRMVIYRNATINNSSISYDERAVFRSRKRYSLPYFEVSDGKLVCRNAPKCNSGNRRTCCSCTFNDDTVYVYSSVGPYRGCEQRTDGGSCEEASNTDVPPELGGGCFDCDEKGIIPVPPLKHMVTPCNFFSPYLNPDGTQDELGEGRRQYIFGYDKIDSDWWFFSDPSFDQFEQDIIQDNPFGSKKHTIVMHFEMRAKQIQCCTRTCENFPNSGTSVGCEYSFPECPPTCHNKINSKCGTCDKIRQFYKDPDERQRRVKIRAAAGFTMECGSFDFNELCNKVWDETIDV